MSHVLCCKYVLKNNSNSLATFNYKRCDDHVWYNQVNLFPGQVKEVFLENYSYSTAFKKSITILSNSCSPEIVVTPSNSNTPAVTPSFTQTPTMTRTPNVTPSITQTTTNSPTPTPSSFPTFLRMDFQVNFSDITWFISNPLGQNFDMTVDWGDGVIENFTQSDTYSPFHTYNTIGNFISYITFVDKSLINYLSVQTMPMSFIVNYTRFPSLIGLLLSQNNLTQFTPEQFLSNQLLVIDLSFNQISQFDPTAQLPASLAQLKLNDNNLTDFNTTYALPPQLQILDLSNNSLTSFNPTSPFPTTLNILNLSGNSLSSFELEQTLFYLTGITFTNPGVIDLRGQINGSCVYSGSPAYQYLVSNGWTIESNLCEENFVSVWRASFSPNTIQLPLESGGTYNFVVDWGDNTYNTVTSWNESGKNHTYTSVGDYTVTITGQIEGFSFGTQVGSGNRNKIIEILQWGKLNLGNSGSYFDQCFNLNLSGVTDVLNLSGTTNLHKFFGNDYNISSINNISLWDVSNVNNMSYMFEGTYFNQNINNWVVSAVTNLDYMFFSTPFNQPLSGWNVSNVTSMNGLFESCVYFDQDISNWDVYNVTGMSRTFVNVNSFDNNILSGWNVSNVVDMSYMFYLSNFNQNIDNWIVSAVTDMSFMFYDTPFNQPLNSWNVSNVTNLSNMFYLTPFNRPLNNWVVSGVTDMSQMFIGCTSFNQDINSWDVSNVTNMENMFNFCNNFDKPLSGWNVSNVTNMDGMFAGASLFNQDLSDWCVSNIPSEPSGFAISATSWVLPKPVWGTCPP